MFEAKSQTSSPFIILQEDIVFNYSFSLTSYSLFLYPNVEKTALGTGFINNASKLCNRSHRFFHGRSIHPIQQGRHSLLQHHQVFQSSRWLP